VPSLDVLADLGDAVGLTLAELFTPQGGRGLELPAEVAAIGAIVGRWPAGHRKVAVRVVGEMDKLLRAKVPSRGHAQ
jgi:hypothetical protein